MLSFKLLRRNWHSGELKILTLSLLLAVALVSALGAFSERLERTLLKQSNAFIAADRVLRSSTPLPEHWLDQARRAGIAQVRLETFTSMVFAPRTESLLLAAVKAVEPGYPLAGELELADKPFASLPADIYRARGVPAPGEAWADSRLLAQLGVGLGDSIELGEKLLILTRVIVREPDRGEGFDVFAPRLLINRTDLAASGVIQPGSRIGYRWLLAGDEQSLQALLEWLKPQLSAHQQLLDLQQAQRGIAATLKLARQFLQLAASLGVLLCGVAVALAARRFAERQIDAVALMKSFGASCTQVRRLYVLQLVWLALLVSPLGLLLGHLGQWAIAALVEHIAGVALQPLGGFYAAQLLALVSALLCLLLFALPPLWRLPQISPLRVLRRDLPSPAQGVLVLIIAAAAAVFITLWLYSHSLALAAVLVGGLFAVAALAALFGWALLALGQTLGSRAGSVWRLAVAGVRRRPGFSTLQVAVFALAFTLLFAMIAVRTQLIDQWRLQLPADTPNHFFVNIAPAEVEPLARDFAAHKLAPRGLYPIVRGRLIQVNGREPSAEQVAKIPLLRREANISWSEALPEGNQLTAGSWWSAASTHAGAQVSVEAGLAERLQLKLGDKLGFSFAGSLVEAEVASIRKLDWGSFQPSFYFLFAPGALDQFAPVYMTSVYIAPADKPLIGELVRSYPSMAVIEVDKILDQVRTIVDRVGRGVELILGIIVAAAALVLAASINASIDSRRQEVGLLRALGSRRGLILGALWIEFALLGLAAGIIAVAGSEALLFGLQTRVFNMDIAPHYLIWWLGPLLAAFGIASFGVLSCRKVVATPPAQVLREAL